MNTLTEKDPLQPAAEWMREHPQPEPETLTKSRVLLVNGSELNPCPVNWLWKHWLAMGKFHLLAGAPGQGKTTIALSLAATITGGRCWPDGTRCEPGNVLIWSGEDDPADTLLPRLLASHADRRRCHFIKGVQCKDGVEPFDPARDLPALKEAMESIGGVRLLIVDPVVSAVTGDSHKNTEVRRALQPLVDLAESHGCAVLGITHFAKGGQGIDPAQRVVGSIAFTAVARVVLVAAKVKGEEGEDRRIMARSKSNIGPDDGGFEYRLVQDEPIAGIPASCIAWGDAVDGNARELLTDPADVDADDEGSALEEAKVFLTDLLSQGPVPTKDIQSEARSAGISWASVRRAGKALSVKKQKGESYWQWLLPIEQVAQGEKTE